MWSRLFGARDAGLGGDADRMIDFFRLGAARRRARRARCPTASRSCSTPRWRSWPGPRLVLLDEPAGGVNLTMLGDLRERLRAINAESGATFVVIEHNMEFVMALCSRVLVLAEGRIIAEGTPRRGPRRTRRSSRPILATELATTDPRARGRGRRLRQA